MSGEPEPDEAHWWLNVAPETIQVARTLAQTTWWVDSEATPHLVDAMTDAHRRAVIEFLVLRARDLLIAVQETHARVERQGATYRAAAELLADRPDLARRDEWLESTPLMRRLRVLTPSEPG